MQRTVARRTSRGPENQPRQITFRISQELYDRIKITADAKNMTVTAWLNSAALKGVEND